MKKALLFLLFIFLVKTALPQSPNWLWAENGGGGNWEYGFGVMLNPSGNIFLGGRVGGTMIFGGGTVNGPCPDNPFVGKFDNAGNAIWLQSHQYSCGNDYIEAFYKDNADNVYSGGIVGSGSGMFYDKHDSAGNVKWLNSVSGGINCLGITADNAGFVYITGDLNPGSYTINPITINNTSGSAAAFVVKLDSNGNALWGKCFMGTGGLHGRDIEVDNLGNFYFSGDYSGTPAFDNITAPASSGPSNYFIAKYDTAGNAQWVSTASSARASDFGGVRAIGIDLCGNIFVSGGFQGTSGFNSISLSSVGGYDIFVAKLLSDGRWEWAVGAGSNSDDDGYAIALDKNYDPYVAGLFQGSAQFGAQTLTSAGGNNLFVAKLANSTGAFQWAQSGGANGGGTSIAVDTLGFSYVTGSFSNTVSFGSHSISCSSTQNPYLAKLDTAPANKISVSPDASYCLGATASLVFSTIGAFNNGNVFTAQLSDSSGSFINATSLGQVASIGGGNISITIPSNIPAGNNYIIRVVSTSPANSSFDYCFRITIGGGLTVNVTPDTSACSGTNIQLSASGGSTYSWSPSTGLNCNTCSTPIANPTSTTTYTVNIASGSCPPVTKTVVVSITPSAFIHAAPHDTSVCSSFSVTLTATGGSTYQWTPGNTLSDSTSATPLATPLASTTYVVSGGACTVPDTVIVNVGNAAKGGDVTAQRDTICSGTSGLLQLNGNSNNIIQWQSSTDGINYTDISGAKDTIKYRTLPLTNSTYFRVTVGTGNCTAISDSLQLIVPPTLTALYTSTVTGTNTISFNSSSSQGHIINYYWDFGDGQTSIEANPTHTFPKDSTYNVCLTIYDGSNCSYTYCRNIALGVPTIAAQGNWGIYPDPFSSELNIDGKELNSRVKSLVLYDVLGRVMEDDMENGVNNSAYHLDVSDLAKGMYYLVIRTADADYVQKVVKQ